MNYYVDWDKINADQVISFALKGMTLLINAGKSAKKVFGKKKADKMLSSIVGELLKTNPDIDLVKVKLLSFQPKTAEQQIYLERAKSMLDRVKFHPKTGRVGRDALTIIGTKKNFQKAEKGKLFRKPSQGTKLIRCHDVKLLSASKSTKPKVINRKKGGKKQ